MLHQTFNFITEFITKSLIEKKLYLHIYEDYSM
jgi:hypothetical protein